MLNDCQTASFLLFFVKLFFFIIEEDVQQKLKATRIGETWQVFPFILVVKIVGKSTQVTTTIQESAIYKRATKTIRLASFNVNRSTQGRRT